MKPVPLLMIAGLVVTGCCSTQNDPQHLSTSDLQLRRYELMYCLSQTRMSWDKQPRQGHPYDDANADYRLSTANDDRPYQGSQYTIQFHGTS